MNFRQHIAAGLLALGGTLASTTPALAQNTQAEIERYFGLPATASAGAAAGAVSAT